MFKKIKFKKIFKRKPKPMSRKEFYELIAGLTDEEIVRVYGWLLDRQ
jgi:hypothetical protein